MEALMPRYSEEHATRNWKPAGAVSLNLGKLQETELNKSAAYARLRSAAKNGTWVMEREDCHLCLSFF